MEYISFYVDKSGVRFGVDLATGKKTRLETTATDDEQATANADPVTVKTDDEG